MKTEKSRFILITGVTKGLGEAMVKKFVSLGHVVAGCGRSSSQINQLKKTFPKPHDFETVDVAKDEEVKKWAGRLLRDWGTPDLVLNNAAVINRNAPLWKVPAEEFSKVTDVNIKGVFHVIRHFAPAMMAKKNGVIVNFSSGWGRSTSPEVAPYCMTKWAIEGLTQAFSQELPEGMAAVAMNPGIINTEMLRSCFAGSASSYPSPDEWAERAVPCFLNLSAKDNGKALSVP